MSRPFSFPRTFSKHFSLMPFLGALPVLLLSTQAMAIRPFVTDDARIIDRGQFEMENWFESARSHGTWDPAPGFNTIVGTSVNDWLEILAGSGVGNDRNGSSTVGNPMLMGKVLLHPAQMNGAPGIAVSASTVFDQGHGSMYLQGRVSSLLAITSWRLQDDRINLHANLGVRSDKGEGFHRRQRIQWGWGVDIHTPLDRISYVAEVFSGDPLILHAPKFALQTGFRRLQSDRLQFDFTFGLAPELDNNLRRRGGYEKTVQVGVRLLFDVFTHRGRPGNPEGAAGFFGWD